MEFDDIVVEEETEEQIRRKKVIRAVIGTFLLMLMVGLSIPHEVLSSILSSETTYRNSISFSNTTIIFENNILQKIQNHFLLHQLTEFKLCLKGTIEHNTYTVNSIYEPKILFASPISVHAISCDKETIIDLHSHPFKNCLFSEQDISTYNHLQKNNKQTLGAVMCDTNRFAFY